MPDGDPSQRAQAFRPFARFKEDLSCQLEFTGKVVPISGSQYTNSSTRQVVAKLLTAKPPGNAEHAKKDRAFHTCSVRKVGFTPALLSDI